jgi:hypothetical protein
VLSMLRHVVVLVSLFTPVWATAADLTIQVVSESSLSYELSPRNYENSPNNYENSIRNYENSASNYENSESNYANSARNSDNGRSGDRRLIYVDGRTGKYVGYYVRASTGVTNFFSPRGTRVFYNPKNGRGVYGGGDGSFCGVLAMVDGSFSLALTENGFKLLLLSQ